MFKRNGRTKPIGLALVLGMALAGGFACSDDDDDDDRRDAGQDVGEDAGVDAGADAGEDAGTDAGDAGDGGVTPMAMVRVAHMSSDAPPVRGCAQIMGGASYAELVGSIDYGQVTEALSVAAGSYDVKVTAGDDCDAAAAAEGSFDLAADTSYTVVAGGLLDPAAGQQALQLLAFVNETETQTSSSTIRFIHVGVGAPAVDVGLVDGSTLTEVWTDVAFGEVADENNGYVVTSSLTDATIGVSQAGQGTILVQSSTVSTEVDTIYTVYAAGVLETGLEAVVCDDTDAKADQGFLQCLGPVPLEPPDED